MSLSLAAQVSSVFSMVTETATATYTVNTVLQHPVIARLRNSLPAPKINGVHTGLLALGLLPGCDGGTTLMLVEAATGIGLLAGAGMLARSALTGAPRQIATVRNQIEQLNQIETKAKDPKELASTVKTRPDITIDILIGIEKEIIDKLANCSKTKIDWDSVIAVCDDLLGEMRELGVSSDQEGYRKIFELKAQAQTENQKLADAAGDLIDQGRKVPSWIEGQKIKVAQLRDKQTREQRLAELQRRVAGLVGKVDDLKAKTAEDIAEAEKLTAEIVATQELLLRVDALTEVEAYLALPMIQDLPQETLADLRQKVAAKRIELQQAEVLRG